MGARAKFRLPPLCPSAIRLGRLTGAATVRAARRSRASSEAIPLLSNFAPPRDRGNAYQLPSRMQESYERSGRAFYLGDVRGYADRIDYVA